jgi:REP element-mobilizing transposase RayT
VTFRLAGSLPIEVLERWREEAKMREKQIAALPVSERAGRRYLEEKRFFGRFDAELDRASYGPVWLQEPAVAQAVYDELKNGDGVLYDLDVFTIMPNHVHAVFTPLPEGESYYALSRIMYEWKRPSAWNANTILGRKGAFWQREYYDHYVRNPGELARIVQYVLNNPVKAGLVDSWEAWPWTYWKYTEDRSR